MDSEFLQFNRSSNGYTGRSSGRDAMEVFRYNIVLRRKKLLEKKWFCCNYEKRS